jgi:hypothetical protein
LVPLALPSNEIEGIYYNLQQQQGNGVGPDDPLAGKLFSAGPIQPKGFCRICGI